MQERNLAGKALALKLHNLFLQLPLMPQLIEVSHASKRGSSLRITIPKKVQEKLGIKEGNIVGFSEEDGISIFFSK